MDGLKVWVKVYFSEHLQISNHCLQIAACNLQNRPKIRVLGLHWFRHGFGRVAGHVEVLLPRKTAEKKLTANDERFALAA